MKWTGAEVRTQQVCVIYCVRHVHIFQEQPSEPDSRKVSAIASLCQKRDCFHETETAIETAMGAETEQEE